MTKHVLVTGGAGYVGAHACKALKQAGFIPVCFDNFNTGWREAVKFGPLAEGDLLDRARLDEVFAQYKPIAVMHFAALSLVGESMTNPSKYWRTNVMAALNLIEAANDAGCDKFVFSSTCATYGDQDGVVLDEMTQQRPINAYGGSKRAIEDMLRDFGASHGLKSVIFRYFNVAGADPDGEIGEQHVPETHLIPLMLDAIAGKRAALTVFGSDYDTEDGTCVRDYVHVSDLVDAHVLGLNWLLDDKPSDVFCLGTGNGFSVREVISQSNSVTNREVPIIEGERRAGDAAVLVSGSVKAKELLGWQPKRAELSTMIADAWRWHQAPDYKA
ncbi:UDP-glucose 4-epimerase GalE [Thioclava sp. SK-1]|uniref:UDP-glucose 4-epimerase GalE n=1 Tax=Thioclava sp. SK-1 TaxID=1889770 RepID=UPI000824EBD7|nr:UDP-glucose 4-epimerase GalE [Thioclava sp. SK-1]OCX65408.1 UDP-glucose 4-epimerase GalE [Thioclava sp. SK-1]